MQKVFYIPKADVDKYNRLMQSSQVNYEEHDILRYEAVKTWLVDLDHGYKAEIRVCSSNYNEPLWCEGMLFWHGSACGCTEVSDDLLREYWFEHNGQQIILVVQAEYGGRLLSQLSTALYEGG